MDLLNSLLALPQQSGTAFAVVVGVLALALLVELAGRVWILWASCGLCDYDAGFGRAALMLLAALVVLLPISLGVAVVVASLGAGTGVLTTTTGIVGVGLTVLLIVHIALAGLLYLPFVGLSIKISYLVAVFEALLNMLFNLLLGGIVLAVLAGVQIALVPQKAAPQPAEAPAAVRPS